MAGASRSDAADVLATGEFAVNGIDLGAPTAAFTLTRDAVTLKARDSVVIPLADIIRWDPITWGLTRDRIDFAYREPELNRRLIVEVNGLEVSGRTLTGKAATEELGRLVGQLRASRR